MTDYEIQVTPPTAVVEVPAHTAPVTQGPAQAIVAATPGGKGNTGQTGATGPRGETGPEGPQGIQGVQGPTGTSGTQGIQGVQGEAGVSLDIEGTVSTYADLPDDPDPGDAYVVAADGKLYFYDGTDWPADGAGVPFRGPEGPQGVKGDAGDAGPEGPQGVQGIQGLTGDTGPSGADGYTPQFVLLTPRQQADYGNGLDGRFPAVSMAAGALGGCYCLGVNGPWSAVDLYIAWMEGTGTPSGVVDLRGYLATPFTPGVRPVTTYRGTVLAASVGVAWAYHETLIASDIAVTPSALMSGTIARYGTTADDTYNTTAGALGIIVRPHT